MTQGPILTAAIIGAGNRGATHLATVSTLRQHFRLVGVCDAREERRQWATETYGVPAFEHPVALLDAVRPQVVGVVVPPDAHHLVTAVAAARGAHIITETPIATTLAMADHMLAAAQRHNVLLEVSENVWRWPHERLKRLVVEQGLLGQVTQVHFWYTSGSYHGMAAMRRFIASRPVRVWGVSAPVAVQPFVEVDGYTRTQRTWELGVIEFAGGELGVYQWPIGTTHGNGWEVVGTQGVIAGNEVVLWEDSRSRRGRRLPIETVLGTTADGSKTITHAQLTSEPPLTWQNPYRQYALPGPDDVARADTWLGLHRSIVEGRPAVYGASARTDLELLIAIRESSRQGGRRLDLPVREPTELERQLHAEFAQQYGAEPFEDAEALLARLFPAPSLTRSPYSLGVGATQPE